MILLYSFKDYESSGNQNNEIKSNNVKIINGEHFKCIFSKLLDLLIENLSKDLKKKFCENIKIAVFNTHYTNNAIKTYLNKLKNLNQFITLKPETEDVSLKTKEFDISIYYKSNGKGTIYSNETILKKIDKLYSICFSTNDCVILEFLSAFLNAFNKTSGDALSTMILFEKSLKFLNLSLKDVYGLFEENPYDFQYVQVENILEFDCDQEYKIVKPKKLTFELDDLIKNVDPEAKCFFKIFKIQNVIRIYVESAIKENVKAIMRKAKNLIVENSNN